MADAVDVALEMIDCWNRRDLTAFRDNLHPEYSYTGGDGVEQKGVDAGMAVAEMFANAFPDGQIDVQRVYRADDETVVVEFIGRGTHKGDLMGIAPTGRRIEIPVVDIMTIRDGKVLGEREYMDMMVIMSQLGIAPASAA